MWGWAWGWWWWAVGIGDGHLCGLCLGRKEIRAAMCAHKALHAAAVNHTARTTASKHADVEGLRPFERLFVQREHHLRGASPTRNTFIAVPPGPLVHTAVLSASRLVCAIDRVSTASVRFNPSALRFPMSVSDRFSDGIVEGGIIHRLRRKHLLVRLEQLALADILFCRPLRVRQRWGRRR